MARGDVYGALIISAPDLARAVGMPIDNTKRWMKRNDIFRKEPGKYGRVYTTVTLIRQAFPEVADDIITRAFEDD